MPKIEPSGLEEPRPCPQPPLEQLAKVVPLVGGELGDPAICVNNPPTLTWLFKKSTALIAALAYLIGLLLR